MKRERLLKLLRKKGAQWDREGGCHEIWRSKSGTPLEIPRHPDINEITAKQILKKAEK